MYSPYVIEILAEMRIAEWRAERLQWEQAKRLPGSNHSSVALTDLRLAVGKRVMQAGAWIAGSSTDEETRIEQLAGRLVNP